jgi:hypothetical protein
VDGGEATTRVEVPVACTLGVEDAAARVRRWQALAEESPPRVRRSGHQLEIRWRLDADGAAELEALVAAERECCAFVEWAVIRQDPDTIVQVTAEVGRPEDVDAIAPLFAFKRSRATTNGIRGDGRALS